jgi:DNA-directed RNA polymerase specialized sigma24 family protein
VKVAPPVPLFEKATPVISAAMTIPDPKTIDWPRVYAEAVALAAKYTKRDAYEVVQEGAKLYVSGLAPWVPEETTLPDHLVSIGRRARSDWKRTERRRWHPAVVSKMVGIFRGSRPTPAQEALAAEERRRKAFLFERLVRELEAHDPEGHKIVLLEAEGVHDALEQAAESGMDIETVRNARKRIKRRVLAIVEEEEDA